MVKEERRDENQDDLGKKKNDSENKQFFRRDLLTGSAGFAAGLAAGSGSVSFLFPPKEVIEKEKTVKEKVPRYICPYDGIEFDSYFDFKAHFLGEHQQQGWVELPGIEKVEKPTYEPFIVGEIERFDQKNDVLHRSAWDKEYLKRIAEAAEKRELRPEKERMKGQAFRRAGIYVDNKAGSTHPDYYGYYGHIRDYEGLYGWEEPVNEKKFAVNDPGEMSSHIKRVAQFLGADLVGITKLDPRWVYSRYFDSARGSSGEMKGGEGELSLTGSPAPESDTNISYTYAIALAVEMKWEGINKSPDWDASAATALGYSKMAEISSKLAEYIRSLGYPAVPSGNDTVQSIPIAIDAGLGELGRHGLLITPRYGPRVRNCQVLTNLPLEQDRPIDFGMQSFCENCKQCAINCPADAIPFSERSTERPSEISNRKGLNRWTVDTPACFLFWVENGTDCSNCIAACPWSDPQFKRERYGVEQNKCCVE